MIAVDEREFEEFVRRNPEEALRLIVKAFKPRELLKIGDRSYVNAFKYPESRFDSKDLTPNGGSLQVLKGDMLQPLRDPSKTFTDQVLIPPSQLIFQLGGRIYSKSGLPETAGRIAGGLTDARAVIQQALNVLDGIGGSAFLKNGVYELKSIGATVGGQTIGLFIPDNVELVGESWNAVIKQADGLKLRHIIAPKKMLDEGTLTPSVFNKNVRIANLKIDGNWDKQGYDATVRGCYGIYGKFDYSTLENLYGVSIGEDSGGFVLIYGEHNFLKNIHGENLKSYGNSELASVLMFTTSRARHNLAVGVYGKNNVSYALVLDDYCEDNHAIGVFDIGGAGALRVGAGSQRNVVEGVYSINAKLRGIKVVHGLDIEIKSPIILNSYYTGIFMNPAAGAVIGRVKIDGGLIYNCVTSGVNDPDIGLKCGVFINASDVEVYDLRCIDDRATKIHDVAGKYQGTRVKIIGGLYDGANYEALDVAFTYGLVKGVTVRNAPWGIYETGDPDYNLIADNDVSAITTAAQRIRIIGSHTKALNNLGFNPQSASTPTVPASPATFGPYSYPVMVVVYGGTVSDISIRGLSTGLTSGTFHLYPGDTITITYTATPTVKIYPL